MSRTSIITATGIALVLYAVFALWTVRRVWREGIDPYSRMVYRFGVRIVGLGTWAIMTVLFTTKDPIGSIPVWLNALIAGFINLPIGLWAGYFWGRSMARFYGLESSD